MAREFPVVWVSGLAGSGKTTLITSYLDSRHVPCLWYSIDRGDGDMATFFYYMGLAANFLAANYKQGYHDMEKWVERAIALVHVDMAVRLMAGLEIFQGSALNYISPGLRSCTSWEGIKKP